MSLRTVEISVPQDVPSVVSIDGGIGPKVVEINQGPAGPNSVTSSTTTTLTGILKGNGSLVGTATAGTDYLTPTGNGSGLTGLVSAQITNATASWTSSTDDGKLAKFGLDGLLEPRFILSAWARAENAQAWGPTCTFQYLDPVAAENHRAALELDTYFAKTSTPSDDGSDEGKLASWDAGGGITPWVVRFPGGGFIADASFLFVDPSDPTAESGIAGCTASGSFINSLPSDGGKILAVTTNANGVPDKADSLTTARTINGVSFDGTANITVTAAAGTLTGTTLASNVVTSSLTSVGTLTNLNVVTHIISTNGNVVASSTGALGISSRSRIYSSSDGTFQFRNNANSADASLTAAGITLTGTPLAASSGGTGLTSLGTGITTFLGTPTSANLATAVTDETGTGSLVFANTPTLISPVLGAATATTLSLGTTLPTATICNVYSSGSSSGNVWRGRMTVGGDTCRFLMGEINGQAWLGAHNAALNAWNDFYINPDGGAKVGIGDLGGGSGNVAVPILTVDNTAMNATIAATTASTSSTTGALVVTGGVGIGGRLVLNNVLRLKGYTFATLPAGTQGDKAFITDGAASPTFRANAAGGGSTVTEVFFNGTNWINS